MQGTHAWLRLCLILLAALLTRILCAAPPLMEDTNPPVREVAPAAPLVKAAAPVATPVTHETIKRFEPPTYLFSLGTGIAAINESAGWVLHWGAMMRPFSTLSLYLGPDFNVHYWGTSPSVPAVTMTGIQAMASGIFAFDLPGTILRSYMGLSFGPFLRNHGGGPIGWSFSTVGRVGMIFLVDPKLSIAVEPRIGLLEGGFVLQGLLNAHILL